MQFFNINVLNLPPHEKKITVSTLITLMRFIIIPFVVYAIITQRWSMACVLFFIATLTDGVDGAVARWRNETTTLGAILDAIADKVLVLSCFAALAIVPLSSGAMPVPRFFFIFVLFKELIQLSGALYMYSKQQNFAVKPTMLGKMTMAAQTLFILGILACHCFDWLPLKTIFGTMIVVMVLVTGSLLQYAGRAVRSMSM